MSQDVFSNINPATTSGTQLATLLNNFKDAMMSGLSGTSRPSQLQAGGKWIDTSQAGSPNFLWIEKLFDGTNDIVTARYNLSTGTISIAGSDNSFEVTKISSDTAGALLKLIKQRASGAQVAAGDTIGELQYIGRTDTAGNPIVARIRSVATNTMTSALAGANLLFEQVVTGTAALVEVMRLIDGKLGLGINLPANTLHVRGTGIKSERYADDATAAKLILFKKRVTGAGQILNADVIGSVDINSVDVAGTEAQTAGIEISATESHTATARGTKMSFKTVKTGLAVLFEHFTLGNSMEVFSKLGIEGYELRYHNVATAATIAQLSADKAIVNFTGSTATTLQGINGDGLSKVILIHNNSSAAITVKNQDTGAVAIDRFLLPNSRDITIPSNSSLEVFYSIVDSRWKLKSGSGSGGGGTLVAPSLNTYATPLTVAAAATITPSAVDSRRIIHVKGDTGGTTLGDIAISGDQFGEVILVGTSDADPLTITNSGNIVTKDGGDRILYANSMAHFILTGTKWILKE